VFAIAIPKGSGVLIPLGGQTAPILGDGAIL